MFEPPCAICGVRPRRVTRRTPKVTYARECNKCRHDRRKGKDNDSTRDRDRRRVLATYDISAAEWESIYHAQGGKCLICQAPLRNRIRHPKPEERLGKTAAVDHRHDKASGLPMRKLVRGLLCAWRCNYRLESWWTPERLRAAADYLEQEPAQKVLRHED